MLQSSCNGGFKGNPTNVCSLFVFGEQLRFFGYPKLNVAVKTGAK